MAATTSRSRSRKSSRKRRKPAPRSSAWRNGLKRAAEKKVVHLARFDLLTGQATAFAVPRAAMGVSTEYIERHDLLPEEVELWSIEQLHARVQDLLDNGEPIALQRALMILAHHRSEQAISILESLRDDFTSGNLRWFWEFAYDEALGHFGRHHFPVASNA
jgi:hypothetical protein